MILSIDPGKDKCGLAILNDSARTLEKKVVSRRELSFEVTGFVAKYAIQTIVVGGSTTSRSVQKELMRMDLRASIVFIEEEFSTQEARKRYFKENPPRGLRRLIPSGLLVPPHLIDDYAAVILGERYLKD